jgi:predicted kinase
MDKELLKQLKSEPPFGAIPFDELIFHTLRKSSSASSASSSERPTLIVLCGPPGCGKSKTKEQLIAQEGVTDYIDIDPDVIRSILEANGVIFSDDKTMAKITNAFNKRMSDQAQKEKLNIVFDTTGQNIPAVRGIINSSKEKEKELKYKTTFAVIWASKDTCKKRVASRNASSGSKRRVLPEKVAEDIYDNLLKGTISDYLINYPVRADKILLYNNDTDDVNADAVLLFSKEGRSVTTSSDFSGFYNMDLTAVAPFIKIKDEPGGSSSKKGGRRRTYRRTYRKNKRSKTKRRKFK